MCVLGVSDKRRPTEEELEKMAATNPDGAGIAWREKTHARLEHPDAIKWEKGLDLSQMKVLCAEAPLPFVFHFRIASCGGKLPELTHPFPIEKEMRSDLSGLTKGSVIFHNGHWGRYRECGIDGAIKNKVRVPEGKWSDTRVMAWLSHLHGPNILELIDEKVILFGPSRIEIFHPEGWFRINDLLVSNQIWQHHFVRGSTVVDDDYNEYGWHNGAYKSPPGNHGSFGPVQWQVCKYGQCRNKPVANTFYCEEHQLVCRWSQCVKSRVAGSEHCAEHQPICTAAVCTKPRIYGEKYCTGHIHLKDWDGEEAKKDRLAAETARLASLREQIEGVEAIKPVIDLVAGSHSEPPPPAVLTDPTLQEESRWARGINPKAIKRNGSTALALVDKLLEGYKGGPTLM